MTVSLQRNPGKNSWQPDDEYDDSARWLDQEDGGDRWRNYVACRNADPALFFAPTIVDPITGIEQDQEPAYPPPEVKKICDHCPVRDICLDRNLEEDYGIYGGTTGFQRGLLTKKNKRKRCPMCGSTDVVQNATQRKEVCLACAQSWDIL